MVKWYVEIMEDGEWRKYTDATTDFSRAFMAAQFLSAAGHKTRLRKVVVS